MSKFKKFILCLMVLLALTSSLVFVNAANLSEIVSFEASQGYTLGTTLGNPIAGGSWYSSGTAGTVAEVVVDPFDFSNQALKISVTDNAMRNFGHDVNAKTSESIYVYSMRIYPENIGSGASSSIKYSGLANERSATDLVVFDSNNISLRSDVYSNGSWTPSTEIAVSNYEKKWYDILVIVDVSDVTCYNQTVYIDGEKFGPYNLQPMYDSFHASEVRFRGYVKGGTDTAVYYDNWNIRTPENVLGFQGSTPENNAIGIMRDTDVVLTFDEYILKDSVSDAIEIVYNETETITPVSTEVMGNTIILKFNTEDWLYDTEYTVKYNNITDIFSNTASGEFTFRTVEPLPFELLTPEFKKVIFGEGEQGITRIEPGIINFSVNVINNAANAKNAASIAVLRVDGEIKGMVSNKHLIEAGEKVNFSGGLYVPENGTDKSISIYMWDSIIGMNALSDYYVFDEDGLDLIDN